MRPPGRIRIFLVYAALTVFFAVAMGRLFWIQVVEGRFYAELAREQSLDRERIPAVRGNIYDRNGYPLAVNKDVVSVYCVPTLVKDKDENAAAVADILGKDPLEVLAKFKSGARSEWLGRDLDPALAKRVMGLRIDGVFAQPGYVRVYPEKELACHVLGYVGSRDGSLAGAERGLNQYLEGLPGVSEGLGDAVGRKLPALTETYVPPLHGFSCVLTIDKWCQHVAERELATAVAENSAEGGVILVMRPSTGEILAMASYPDYDPNRYNKYRPECWRNNAISAVYEPGSGIKPFIVAAALEEGAVDWREEFDVSQALNISGYTVTDPRPRDAVLNVEDIIAYSSNIGIVKISNRLGSLRTFEYLERFGFGSPTGVNLPAESQGILKYEHIKYPVGRAFVSFGQGIAVTPLQMALAACAIANDGLLMRPMLALSVLDDTGREVYRFKPVVERRVISPDVAYRVRLMMEQTVVRGGGVLAAVSGYRVAGKTGTSEVARSDGKGYLRGVYTSSFVGLVPVEEPAVVILVVIFRPKGEFFGGKVAAPVFSRVAADILPSLKVPPSGTPTYGGTVSPVASVEFNEFEPTPAALIARVTAAGYGVRVAGKGTSVGRVKLAGEGGPGGVVMLCLEGDTGEMPLVAGLPLREAMRLLAPTRARVTVEGNGGYVVAQSPPPGHPVPDTVKLRLGFTEPTPLRVVREAKSGSDGGPG